MFDVQGDTQILTFQIAGGQWVVIQAPVSLGWDSAELAKFASGRAGAGRRSAGARLSLPAVMTAAAVHLTAAAVCASG